MKKIAKIGDKKIGDKHPTYIIAEIGSNHNRNIKTAKKLIDLASKAGVDAVKFQTYKAETLYSKKTPKFSKYNTKPFDLIKSIELPKEWHKELFEYAKGKNLHFLSTPFDYDAVDLLDNIGVPAFKIASFEIVDLDLIRYAAKKKKPMIISTGMANLEEIKDAINAIKSTKNEKIMLLQCTSLYPAKPELINLKAIPLLKNNFRLPVGLSDHSLGIHIPLAAVGIGANIIEKHFTLDRKNPGPDNPFAIEPKELVEMVRFIRDIEKSLGSGVKKVSDEEKKENYVKGRRSIHANKYIKRNTIIKRDMLIIKRPGYGIKPKNIDLVVGQKAKININKDDWITWAKISGGKHEKL